MSRKKFIPVVSQQFIISKRVKINFLSDSYSYEIDGKLIEGDWTEEDVEEAEGDRELMFESALDEVALVYSNEYSESDSNEQYEAFEYSMRLLHNQLLPNNQIEL